MKNKIVSISSIDDASKVLKSKRFRADHPLRNTRQVFGPSVVDTERETHRERKRQWSLNFSKEVTENKLSDIVSSALRRGFEYANSKHDLFLVCEYVPNKVVLGVLNLDGIDPIAHYEKLKPIAKYLEDSTRTDSLAGATEYVRARMFAEHSNLFDCLGKKERESEIALFLIAGTETTIIAMKILTILWSTNYEIMKAKIKEHGTESVIIDALIQDVPLGIATRYCADNTLLGEHNIINGDIVNIDLGEACRQTGAQKNGAESLSSDHLVFGLGRHGCPGAHLAMLELKQFLEILVTYDPAEFEISTLPQDGGRPLTFRHPPSRKIEPRLRR